MALGSQQANLGSISGGSYTGVIHEMYAEGVRPAVKATSIFAQLMTDAGPGQYRIEGESLKGSVDLKFASGAMHTTGVLPDHMEQDAVEWEITPTRAYRRGAIDNLVQKRGVKGPGSHEDILGRLFDQMFDSFKRLEIRSAIGGSTGIICVTDTRTSATVVVMKNGYNHVGTQPLMHLTQGMVLAWLDISNSYAVGGAGKIASTGLAYTTKTVTFTASIENGSGTPTLVAGDVWVAATTTSPTADYFGTEYNVARNGFMDIVDPDNTLTTIFGISEATHARHRPFREASGAFDHIELTEHWQKLAGQSSDLVTPQTHVAVTSGAAYAELARTLEGYQQQQNLGRTFEGGYQAVRVANMDIVPDPWFLHDVLTTLCLEELFNANLGDGPDYFDEDGSMFQRIGDFDGKEWFIADYRQWFSPVRNRHAALTGISLANVNEDDFTPVPTSAA